MFYECPAVRYFPHSFGLVHSWFYDIAATVAADFPDSLPRSGNWRNSVGKVLRLFNEEVFDLGFVSRRNESRGCQVTFPLSFFLPEDVAFLSVFPIDPAAAGTATTLLPSGGRFHFWHFD